MLEAKKKAEEIYKLTGINITILDKTHGNYQIVVTDDYRKLSKSFVCDFSAMKGFISGFELAANSFWARHGQKEHSFSRDQVSLEETIEVKEN